MLQKHKEALKECPKWLPANLHYEVIMGSYAYGVHTKDSDKDIYGWCIPPKEYIFPFSYGGYIYKFGKAPQSFEQFHKCYDNVDFSIFNIVKYFDLCMGVNPNMIDSLFVPENCICQMTKIGKMVRDERHLFLCSKAKHTYSGYAFSQMRKLKNKDPSIGKRKELIEKYGYDTKFSYHIVRLLDYAEQILQFGDLDLQRDKERWKSIRAGEWSIEQIDSYFNEKEKYIQKLYENTKLPYEPREKEIKELLLNCLEQHYGKIDNLINNNDNSFKIIQEIQNVLNKYS